MKEKLAVIGIIISVLVAIGVILLPAILAIWFESWWYLLLFGVWTIPSYFIIIFMIGLMSAIFNWIDL